MEREIRRRGQQCASETQTGLEMRLGVRCTEWELGGVRGTGGGAA
jgi:hypothetical protein